MKRPALRILAGILIVFSTGFTAFASFSETELKVNTEIRPGVRVLASASVLVLDRPPGDGATILALPGLVHTGNTFRPWAQHILASSAFQGRVARIVLLNLPAHDGSSTPFPDSRMTFGDLTLDDYATLVLDVLAKMKQTEIGADLIVGHSMGGMLMQMAQQRLLDEGRSLHEAFGISSVLLLASTLPQALPWYLADFGIVLDIAGHFVNRSDALGTYLDVPAQAWVCLFFSTNPLDPACPLPPGAPTPDAVDTNQYRGPEPLAGLLQLVGFPLLGIRRPQVAAGMFGSDHGTALTAVSFGDDAFWLPGEQQSLYEYLSDDPHLTGFVPLVGSGEIIHDTYILNPAALDGALDRALSAAGH